MEREQKDTFFLMRPQSPIPLEERENLKGLDCYPPDPDYRFELKLHEHPARARKNCVRRLNGISRHCKRV